MIAYEDLCQKLERYNMRRRNADELASLEREETGASVPSTAATAIRTHAPPVDALAAGQESVTCPDEEPSNEIDLDVLEEG